MEDFQGRCFVIQPFSEPFNARYNEIFEPAIRAAKLEPYRVDKDLSVKMPIDSIQQEIKESVICLADITLDNPNVWYELGYARALNKDVMMLCGPEREGNKFPFDVQHLTINRYNLNLESAYGELRKLVSNRLQALLKKQDGVKQIAQSPLQPIEGLESPEITTLALILENSMTSTQGVDFEDVANGMYQAGFIKLAAGLAIKKLIKSGLIECREQEGQWGHTLKLYLPTTSGEDWLLQNQSNFQLHISAPTAAPTRRSKPQAAYNDNDFDDTDPFADE